MLEPSAGGGEPYEDGCFIVFKGQKRLEVVFVFKSQERSCVAFMLQVRGACIAFKGKTNNEFNVFI